MNLLNIKNIRQTIYLFVLAFYVFVLVACGNDVTTLATDSASFDIGPYSQPIEFTSSSTINEYNEESQGQGFENNEDSTLSSSSSESVLFSSSSLNHRENSSSSTSNSSSSNDCVVEVCSLEELPKCSVDYKTATVKGEGFLYYCLNGNWKNSGGYYDGGCTIRAKCSESGNMTVSSSSVVTNIYDCNIYKCMSTEYLNQQMLAEGKYGELLDIRDSLVYRTIQIGEQVWMAQNLNYSNPKYMFRGEDIYSACNSDCNVIGRVYNLQYYATDACPSGWHIPNEAEFETLFKTVGVHENTDGSILMSSKVSRYSDPYGFSAYGGNRAGTVGAITFDDTGRTTDVFWTSTSVQYGYFEAYTVLIGYTLSFLPESYLHNAFRIRCIKN